MYEREKIARPKRRIAPPTTSAAPESLAVDAVPAQSHAGMTPQRSGVAFAMGNLSVFPPEPQIGPGGGELAPDLARRIGAQQGRGNAMEPSVQQRMEGALGHNFADVRVHADEEADTLSRGLRAKAFTVGSDIFLNREAASAGPNGGDALVAHELTHVVQQRGAQRGEGLTVGAQGDAREQEAAGTAAAVSGNAREPMADRSRSAPSGDASGRMVSPTPAPHSLHQQVVQREPDAKPAPPPPQTGALTVATASQMVTQAYHYVFENQRAALDRLHDALQKKKASSNLIANIATAAVSAALTALLGPVGPAAAEGLVMAEDEVGRFMVEKTAKLVTDKVIDRAKEGVQEWLSASKKSDSIDNFIEAQKLALNRAEEQAIQTFLSDADKFSTFSHGPMVLQVMANVIDAQAVLANSLQMAHSAGAWASLIAEAGDDSKAWANDDHESYAEKGALEIDAHVKNAPITGPGDFTITGSNWRGINKETERVLQEHGGAKISDLGVNLRITLDTPFGETRCEIAAGASNPIIPEKSTMQGVMAWLVSGKMNPSPLDKDRAEVITGAAMVGIYMQQKDVAELHFG